MPDGLFYKFSGGGKQFELVDLLGSGEFIYYLPNLAEALGVHHGKQIVRPAFKSLPLVAVAYNFETGELCPDVGDSVGLYVGTEHYICIETELAIIENRADTAYYAFICQRLYCPDYGIDINSIGNEKVEGSRRDFEVALQFR